MKFNEKIQTLRKQKGITQEELAAALFVSRTAISKWESGRGYPNIDSLKALAKFYEVTVDELLSGEELLSLAEEDKRRSTRSTQDLLFGILDLSSIILLFVPLFRQSTDGTLRTVALMSLSPVAPYIKGLYLASVIAIVLYGVLIFAMQNINRVFWVKSKYNISLALSVFALFAMIAGLQPYPAIIICIFLSIKVALLLKRH